MALARPVQSAVAEAFLTGLTPRGRSGPIPALRPISAESGTAQVTLGMRVACGGDVLSLSPETQIHHEPRMSYQDLLTVSARASRVLSNLAEACLHHSPSIVFPKKCEPALQGAPLVERSPRSSQTRNLGRGPSQDAAPAATAISNATRPSQGAPHAGAATFPARATPRASSGWPSTPKNRIRPVERSATRTGIPCFPRRTAAP